jgi:hypothetical protein
MAVDVNKMMISLKKTNIVLCRDRTPSINLHLASLITTGWKRDKVA